VLFGKTQISYSRGMDVTHAYDVELANTYVAPTLNAPLSFHSRAIGRLYT